MVQWESSRRLLTELLESIFRLFPLFTHVCFFFLGPDYLCSLCFLVYLRSEYKALKFRDICSVCLGARETPCPHACSPISCHFHLAMIRLCDHFVSLWLYSRWTQVGTELTDKKWLGQAHVCSCGNIRDPGRIQSFLDESHCGSQNKVRLL